MYCDWLCAVIRVWGRKKKTIFTMRAVGRCLRATLSNNHRSYSGGRGLDDEAKPSQVNAFLPPASLARAFPPFSRASHDGVLIVYLPIFTEKKLNPPLALTHTHTRHKLSMLHQDDEESTPDIRTDAKIVQDG